MKWVLPTMLVLCSGELIAQSPLWPPPDSVTGDTLFTDCAKTRAHHVVSSLSYSENGLWRAYVDVDQTGPDCLLKTSLWIARADQPYQLAYFMAPYRENGGNGMQIVGWMPGSSVVLVRTERWQWGSDADDVQQVLAIEAPTGRVYEPKLEDILQAHSGKQCSVRVEEVGFGSLTNIDILVRVKLSTSLDPDATEEDVPANKRCGNLKETWSFDFSSGYEVRQVSNEQALLLFVHQAPG